MSTVTFKGGKLDGSVADYDHDYPPGAYIQVNEVREDGFWKVTYRLAETDGEGGFIFEWAFEDRG